MEAARVDKHKYLKRISIAAGSLSAVSLGAPTANADIIHYNGPEISIDRSSATPVSWDVDGLGDVEFELYRSTNNNSISIGIKSASNPSNLVREVVVLASTPDKLQNLPMSLPIEDFSNSYAFSAAGMRKLLSG